MALYKAWHKLPDAQEYLGVYSADDPEAVRTYLGMVLDPVPPSNELRISRLVPVVITKDLLSKAAHLRFLRGVEQSEERMVRKATENLSEAQRRLESARSTTAQYRASLTPPETE